MAGFIIFSLYLGGQDTPSDQAPIVSQIAKENNQPKNENAIQAKVFELTRARAEAGDEAAQVEIGNAYDRGKGVAMDDSKALQWYLKAAQQGNPTAQSFIALLYDSAPQPWYGPDINVPNHKEIADLWYRKAFLNFESLAEKGDPIAQFHLGWIYFQGFGVPKNEPRGIQLIRSVADRGDFIASNYLGMIYRGWSSQYKDYKEAAAVYHKAAEQGGDNYSKCMLSKMYLDGEGVTQDYVQAYMWNDLCKKALKDKGDWESSLASHMTPAQIKEAQRLADEWEAQHPATVEVIGSSFLLPPPPAIFTSKPATDQELIRCSLKAAKTYQVPPYMLYGIAKTSDSLIGQDKKLTDDGPYMIGRMQVDSQLLPELAAFWNTDVDTAHTWVRDDGCLNINVSAWVLKKKILDTGSLYRGITLYHSNTVASDWSYVDQVIQAASKILSESHPSNNNDPAK